MKIQAQLRIRLADANGHKSQGDLDPLIIGGTSARIEDFYWQVLIFYKDIPFCGGAIITARKVVTAAHCLYKKDIGRLKLRAGSSRPDAGGVIATFSKIVQNPNLNKPTILNNDIAVILLREALVFGEAIGAISIGSANPATGTVATVSGFGSTIVGDDKATVLHSVDVPVVDRTVCARNYKDYPGKAKVTENMLCAGMLGVGGKDACRGDSGGFHSFAYCHYGLWSIVIMLRSHLSKSKFVLGPLVVRQNGRATLIGIISWGHKCADAKYPGVYTRVSQYIKWIDSIN